MYMYVCMCIYKGSQFISYFNYCIIIKLQMLRRVFAETAATVNQRM